MNTKQLLMQALTQHRAGQLAQAQSAYRVIVQQQPRHAEAWHLLGVSHHQLGDLHEAERCIRKALAYQPGVALYYNNLANVVHDAKRIDEAIALYEKALALDPQQYEVYNDLAVALKNKGEYARACAYLQRLIAKVPTHAVAYNNLGNTQRAMGHAEQAIAAYRTALVLQPTYADAYCNLGSLFLDEQHYAAAIDAFTHALQQQPSHLGAWLNQGIAWEQSGQWQQARACYDAALAQHPDAIPLRLNRAYLALRLGDFALGWRDYELRFSPLPQRVSHWCRESVVDHSIGKPRWQGTAIDDACLYVYAEQGIGDEIMFAQNLALLLPKAKQLIVATDPRLVPLLSRAFMGVQVIAQQQELPPHYRQQIDYEIALASSCQYLYQQRDDFPRPTRYLFADPLLQQYWRERLAQLGPGLTIGIAWRGGKAQTDRLLRSTRLQDWLPLLRLPQCHFINLQYGDTRQELQALHSEQGIVVHQWDEIAPLRELEHSAALLTQLDLVISVDNSTVHLSGSLGVTTWVLLPFYSDWRWSTHGEDSHWYASVRLVRQSHPGDWSGVFAHVKQQITQRFGVFGRITDIRT